MKPVKNIDNNAVYVTKANGALRVTYGTFASWAVRMRATNLRPEALLLAIVSIAVTIAAPVQAQVSSRPLSDFINAQGTTKCFTPPAPAQLGWGTGADKTNGNANLTPGRFALIDYSGVEANYLLSKGINLGTTVSGAVIERPLPDGRALITVDLHTHNALGWAIQAPIQDVNTDPLVIGARVQDLVADPTRKPALGESHFSAHFIITKPGAPLPDLVGANYDPVFCPNVVPYPWSNIQFIAEEASITGPLHASPDWLEGTSGKLDVKQTGIQPGAPKGGTGPLSDAYPVESITVTRIGQGTVK
jgi:hypothetical protein